MVRAASPVSDAPTIGLFPDSPPSCNSGGVSSRNSAMTDERRQFEWQVMRHIDAAYNVARWYLKNDEDAEDAVQDSVLNAFKSFPKFKGTDGKPWLLKIVRNRCLRQLDRQRKFPTFDLDDDF